MRSNWLFRAVFSKVTSSSAYGNTIMEIQYGNTNCILYAEDEVTLENTARNNQFDLISI